LEAFLEDYPLSDRRRAATELLTAAREKMVKKRFDAARQYYRMGNRISSRLYYEDIVTEHPNSRYAPESLFMLARIDVKEDKYVDARDKLNNLLSAFPEAEIAEKARELREEIRQKAAEQEQRAGAETSDQEE
jgi:outer membrane protein assembly factor BamD